MSAASCTNIPKHIAIIMDGNGRWATSRGFKRVVGHKKGAEVALDVTRWCYEKGVNTLTLFALSTENMSRSAYEIAFITQLLTTVLKREADDLISKGICVHIVGDHTHIDGEAIQSASSISHAVGNQCKMQLNICFNFSGRWHMESNLKEVVREVLADQALEAEVFERFKARMYSHIHTDADMVIRTGNEQRISNFMLWHMAYSELYFESCFWPDYDQSCLNEALCAFSRRKRRFGRVKETCVNDEAGVSG